MEKNKNQRRLYNDLSHLWHLVSPLEDYLEETELFCELLKNESKIPIRELLHFGCGRGHNDYIFKNHFRVTGVDLSPAMLNWAKRLNPEVDYIEGDMRDYKLGNKFDAVTAVDSVDYLITKNDLHQFFQNVYHHLNQNGIFMFILESTRETFQQDDTIVYSNSSGDEWLTVIENRFDPDGTDSEYEITFVYLYRQKGELEIFTDRHLCGLYSESEVHNLLTDVGFKVRITYYHPPDSAFGSVKSANKETFPMFLSCK